MERNELCEEIWHHRRDYEKVIVMTRVFYSAADIRKRLLENEREST